MVRFQGRLTAPHRPLRPLPSPENHRLHRTVRIRPHHGDVMLDEAARVGGAHLELQVPDATIITDQERIHHHRLRFDEWHHGRAGLDEGGAG